MVTAAAIDTTTHTSADLMDKKIPIQLDQLAKPLAQKG